MRLFQENVKLFKCQLILHVSKLNAFLFLLIECLDLDQIGLELGEQVEISGFITHCLWVDGSFRMHNALVAERSLLIESKSKRWRRMSNGVDL